jgi:non-heme chloroperoxidase
MRRAPVGHTTNVKTHIEDGCSANTSDLPPARPLRIVTSDGASLRTASWGEGPPVVLVHGITATLEDWQPLTAMLVERGNRVIAFDLRGHGDSTVGTDGCTADRLGRDVLEVVAAHGAEGALACGHSLGGFSLLAASGDADLLAGLVLLGTTFTARGVRELLVLALAANPGTVLVQRLPIQGWWATRLTNFGAHAPVDVVADVRRRWSRCPLPTRLAYARDLMGDTLAPILGDIHVPAVVVRGSRDLLVSDHRSAELAGALPYAHLHRIEGAGHAVHLEATAEVAELLNDLAAAVADRAERYIDMASSADPPSPPR